MRAMILAAGLGKRMRPLTDKLPKPLLLAAGKPLLQHTIEKLVAAGVTELVINLAYRGQQIRDFVGDGSRFGARVSYSEEARPLETGGGLSQALPLLGEQPFLLINGDVWSDYPLAQLARCELPEGVDGNLVLVPSPDFNTGGDFSLAEDGFLSLPGESVAFTFSGISLLHPRLIADYPRRRQQFPLVEVLRVAATERRLTGQLYQGDWRDIGTPERLQQLERDLLAGAV